MNPNDTLVGYFQHELGLYFRDRLVLNRRTAEFRELFRELFGDERSPFDLEVLTKYHQSGFPENWHQSCLGFEVTGGVR